MDKDHTWDDQVGLASVNAADVLTAGKITEGWYSCNNITTTLIQISRLFYLGFFSKINHQMII